MATKLIANYSKKAGLPGYSSVQYSLTVETKSHELCELLQESVDRELQNPGFVPEASYGKETTTLPPRNGGRNSSSDEWACSPKPSKKLLSRWKETS